MNRIQDSEGHYDLPGSRQWSPAAKEPVDKTKWKPCENCGRLIPVSLNFLPGADGRFQEAATWTYVCPFCSHCHIGTPSASDDDRTQATCHECRTILAGLDQCPKCSFPRGWMRVSCPYCNNRQPVYAPHWVARCDMFSLECVRCESVFYSLCIC